MGSKNQWRFRPHHILKTKYRSAEFCERLGLRYDILTCATIIFLKLEMSDTILLGYLSSYLCRTERELKALPEEDFIAALNSMRCDVLKSIVKKMKVIQLHI